MPGVGTVVAMDRSRTGSVTSDVGSRLTGTLLPIALFGVRRLRGRKSPFQMTLSLTNRCNFRCEYCKIPLEQREELNPTEWCDVIDELNAGGMGRVSLMGGEPLLYKGIGRIIRHLRSRGIYATMNTNGWLVPSLIDEIAPLDLVCVTLDGPSDVHDAQRHPGSYERAIRAIEMLRERGVQVVTMTVVTPRGTATVDHVLSTAREMGFRAYFQLVHHADFHVGGPVAAGLSDDGVQAFSDHLAHRKAAGWPVGNSDSILRLQRRQRYLGTCADCYAGTYFGYVFSDGTVSHCLFTVDQVQRGNGRKRGFLNAFLNLPEPQGPGCSCVPSHEVNQVLDFNLAVLRDAVGLTLRTGHRGDARAAWEGAAG
jgi:MoaA/NifB/PqqE/SkfB family radical SAM enzyme